MLSFFAYFGEIRRTRKFQRGKYFSAGDIALRKARFR